MMNKKFWCFFVFAGTLAFEAARAEVPYDKMTAFRLCEATSRTADSIIKAIYSKMSLKEQLELSYSIVPQNKSQVMDLHLEIMMTVRINQAKNPQQEARQIRKECMIGYGLDEKW